MEENVLQKDFFKKNPLQELSAAAIADFGAKTILIDSINEKMNDIVGMSMSKERRTKAEQDQQDVAQLANGEDVVRYMPSFRKFPNLVRTLSLFFQNIIRMHLSIQSSMPFR